MALTLHQIFIIWLVCSANYTTLQNLTNADYAAIDARAGLPAGTAANVIAAAIQRDGQPPIGNSPLEQAASIFDAVATQQGYVPPLGGRPCGSVAEILGGI
jgi:hypothetical protein